jgi:hypothetical protein
MKTLKELCMEALVEQIKSLPPMLQEEVINETKKSIKKKIEQKVTKQVYDTVETHMKDIIEENLTSWKNHGVYDSRSLEWTRRCNPRVIMIGNDITKSVIDIIEYQQPPNIMDYI